MILPSSASDWEDIDVGGARSMGLPNEQRAESWREIEASGEENGGGLAVIASMTRGTHLKPPAGVDPVQDFALCPDRKQRRQHV